MKNSFQEIKKISERLNTGETCLLRNVDFLSFFAQTRLESLSVGDGSVSLKIVGQVDSSRCAMFIVQCSLCDVRYEICVDL